jgi:hypothetical protein
LEEKYMAKFVASLAFFAIVFLASSAAFSQDAAAPAPAPTGGTASQVTEYDFEDDLVTGDLVRPDGELVGARRKAKTSLLIKVRQHFIPEILKSVENL